MDRLALAQRYFDGWNAHDARGIAATFAPGGGTYTDPIVQGLDPDATGAYAVGLAAAFPDLRFELVTSTLTDDGAVAAQWVMRGAKQRIVQRSAADRPRDRALRCRLHYVRRGRCGHRLGHGLLRQRRRPA